MNGIQNSGRCTPARKPICLIIGWAMWASTVCSSVPAAIPTINPARTFTHPAPAADTFFGPIVDVSSKYVAVLGGRARNLVATHYDAFIFDAATGQHLWTLTQPVPPDNVNFRFESIAIDGDTAVIGATYAHVATPEFGTAFNAGAAYVYDLSTGQLKHKLVSDTPQLNSLLGSSVDILGERIVAGSWGNAYVFDAHTGDQLAMLNPSTRTGQFGISVAISESAIVAGSNSDTTRGEFTGAAFAFDPQTFEQLSKFVPSNAAASDNFGIDVAVDGPYAIGSSRAGSYVFDVTTGTQLTQLNLPGSTIYTNSVDIEGSTALLGNPVLERAMTFDWTTGGVLRELAPGVSSGDPEFGFSVALSGSTAVVGSRGAAYLYIIPEPPAALLLLIGLTATRLAEIPRVKRRRPPMARS